MELECKKCIFKKIKSAKQQNKVWYLEQEQRVVSFFLFVLIFFQRALTSDPQSHLSG